MKNIFLLLVSISIYANINVTQNIRALYKDVKLTEVQKDYILDNQEMTVDLLQKEIRQETKALKQLDDKNIVSFVLTKYGEIKNIHFLVHSDIRKLDKKVKKSIMKIAHRLPRPKEDTELRYIIHYYKGQKVKHYSPATAHQRSYEIEIARGTTRFEHSSKEYVRVFETSEDGFVNVSTKPQMCATIKILTNKNQLMHKFGAVPWEFNMEIQKGKYKILIKTNKTCDVSLQYL